MEKKVWLLIDSRVGSNGQSRGIAKVLGWEVEEKNIVYNFWSDFPNLFLGASLRGIAKKSRQLLQAPFPDLVISASRRSAPVARWIKKQTHGQTKIVQVMHPGNVGLSDFDRVFVSDHDRYKKQSPNIFYVAGCAHRFTPETLQQAQEQWQPKFDLLPRPLTAVIVGGNIKKSMFGVENARELGKQIRAYKQKYGGSILITTSRRTGEKAQNALMKELEKVPAYTYLWGVDKGENPYYGFLACADDIIVTGDSVSMCSEACGSGKRVMIFCGQDWLRPKHYRFVESFFAKGLAFPLGEKPLSGQKYQSYNAAESIVEEIKKLF